MVRFVTPLFVYFSLSTYAAAYRYFFFFFWQEWKDELLTWDPNDFGGLKIMRMPCERIWLPDIVLYNK